MTESTSPEIAKNWKKPFFMIWTGQAFSLLGSQLVQFALIWYLTQKTGSATVLATAALVGMLPQVFLGPLAGSWVDRGNRRRIMIVADSAIALLTLFLAALFAFGVVQVWHIYALMFLRSLGQSFHGPAFGASTSLMVPKEHLARVQGVNQTLNGGLSILSAPLGAVLLALLPMQGILAVDIITAIIAVGTLFFIAIPQPEKYSETANKETSFWEDFRAGFRYVFTWPGLLITLLMAMMINFLLTPASSLTPLLVSKYFGGGAYQLAWFEASFSVGVILGGILLGVWGGFKRRIMTTMFGLLGIGVFMAVVGVVPPSGFNIALGAMFAAGIAMPLTNGSLGAIFQSAIDPGMQGRVFTLINSLASGMTPLSLILAGPVADRLGVQTWYVTGGVICALMGLVGFFIPTVMKLEDGKPVVATKLVGATEK